MSDHNQEKLKHAIKDTGGSAFPITQEQGGNVPESGMTLRDYFAAKALPSVVVVCKGDTLIGTKIEDHFAQRAYKIADAMIRERAK